MKDQFLKCAVSYCIAILLFATSLACSDKTPAPIKSDDRVNESPVSFVQPIALIEDESPVSLTQPLVRVQGAWQVATKLGSASFELDPDAYTHGPHVDFNNVGDGISYWRTYSNFDPQTGNYLQTQFHLKKFSASNNIWLDTAQMPVGLDLSVMQPVVKLHNTSSKMSLLWEDKGFLKYSYHDMSNWQSPKIIGSGQRGQLILSENDDLLVLSINENASGTANLSASFASNNFLNKTAIRGSETEPVKIEKVTAILTDANNAVVVWQEKNKFGQDLLWSAQLSASLGWHNVVALPINAISMTKLFKLKLVANVLDSSLRLFLDYANITSRSVATIDFTNSNWSEFAVNTYLTSGSHNSIEDIEIADNARGDAAIVWRDTQSVGSSIFTQVYAQVYNSITGWGLPIPISQPLPAVNGSSQTSSVFDISKPTIAMNDNGVINVVWNESGQGRSDLLSSQLNVSNPIKTTPELLASYPSVESTIVSTFLVVDNANKTHVTWQEKVHNNILNHRNFWVSQSLGSGSGSVVEVPLQIVTNSVTTPIQISALWQTPSDVWTDTIFSNTTSYIHGPHLEMSDAGSGFMSLYKSTNFDPVTNGYLNQESVVLNRAAANSWSLDNPFPNTTAVVSNEIEIKATTNGEAYALWLADGSVYFNHYATGVGWGAEMNLGLSDVAQDLMVDTAGNAWIFWVLGTEVHLQQYIPATGLEAEVPPSSLPSAWSFASPVIDATGIINIAWISLELGTFSSVNVLNIMRYTPGTGWGFPEIAPVVNSHNPMDSELTLVASANDEVIAVSQDTHGNVFAISFSPTNSWGNWENLDYNLDKSDHVFRSVHVVSAGANNVMAVWSERTLDVDGSRIYRIYSNKYDPVGDANGVHWPIPERVGAIVPQFDANGNQLDQYRSHPKIALLADGRAIATWLDSSETTSALHANQYTPGTGWGATPDQVVSYDRLATGVIRSPDVAALPDGSVSISWRQEIATEFANEIHVWAIEGQM